MAKYTNEQLERLVDDIENWNENHDLSHGNSEVYYEAEWITSSIEAPGHTTWSVLIGEDDIEGLLEEGVDRRLPQIYRKSLASFDVDDLFDEMYHPGFEYRPSEFVDILRDDETHFLNTVG